MFIYQHHSFTQSSAKDSLIDIVVNSPDARQKLNNLNILLNQYLVDEANLDQYISTVNTIDPSFSKEILPLLKIIQENYCDLGLEEECVSSIQKILDLANRERSSNYIVKAHVAKAKYLYNKGEFEEAKAIMQASKLLINNEKSPIIKSSYYYEKARQNRLRGSLDSAIYYINYSLSEIDKKTETSEVADLYNEKGLAFRRLGSMDSAEHNYLKSLEISETLDLKRKLPKLYNNLGNIGHIKGDYNEAIAYYIKSIELKEKQGNLRGLAVGYHNIGAIKNDMLDYEGAIKEFEKSDLLSKQVDYKLLSAYNSLKLGVSFENLEDYKKAIEKYEEALEIAEELKFKKGINSAHLGLGINYTLLQMPTEAITNLLEALRLAEEIGDKSEECSALVAIAEWYNNFGNTVIQDRNVYTSEDIEQILLRAKDLSEEMNYGEKRLSVYKGLETFYKKNKNYRKQADVLSEFLAYKDTLFSKNRSESIASWETKYATAEKEKEIIQLQAENKISELKTRTWKAALGLTTIFLSLFGFFLYKYQKKKNEQKQLKEAENFRSKLSSDLHDDVGTMLSSLAMQSEVMGLTAKNEQVAKFEKLSRLSREAMTRMRDTVWAIDSRKDKVDDLLDRMKDYLADRLEGHKLKVEFDSSEVNKQSKLRPDIRQNIYLIFKEAVHNAAKYSNGDKLKIVFKQNEKEIFLEVRDNGKVDPEIIQTSGLGTSNMKLRAERIGKQLEISTDNGFAVIVK